ncbi:MAG: Crp/Fnr family transcriptional regulator [Hyphomonadaceae bacterium]
MVRARRRSVISAKAHQIILRKGEAPTHIYTLHDGWAYRAVHLDDGRRQILSFALPGDVFCLETMRLPEYRLPYAMHALTQVTLCAFDVGGMRELLSSPEAQFRVAVECQRQSALLERRLVDIGRRRAVGRLARLVLDLESLLKARGLASGEDFDFPLRREDVADALGLTSEHVSRTLVAMKSTGVLDVHQGRAYILDREQLDHIATVE